MRKSFVVAVVVAALLIVGTVWAATPLGSDTFGDVPVGHYADEAIGWAVAEGITSGCGEARFCPDQMVTRAQIMTFLHRSREIGAPTTTTTVPIDREWPTAELIECYIIPAPFSAGHMIVRFELTAPSPIKEANVKFDVYHEKRIVSFASDQMNWGGPGGFAGPGGFDYRWWIGQEEPEWDQCHVWVDTVRWAD